MNNQSISQDLAKQLMELAEKYETPSFTFGDPSSILCRYTCVRDIEVAAFIASMLAFGRRDQFLPKIDYIMNLADKKGGPASWLENQCYKNDFIPKGLDSNVKFYRFYSYGQLVDLFHRLESMLNQSETFGQYVKMHHEEYRQQRTESGKEEPLLAESISLCFKGCAIVPQGINSANKRIHMFLRWMVRQNSPVDKGLWAWYSPSKLIIPLDTHVIQQAIKLGLLPQKAAATSKTAKYLTDKLKEIWPQDPCRGDFALFGSGVDK